MTQHTEFIKRLRYEPTASQYLSLSDLIASLHEDRKNAANALEAQAREIAELKAQLAATAKNAFESMPHDIPRRMKDAICEETGWSGGMVSRMYTELRKAFTGEPYKANEDLDAALLEVARLRKDAERYAWLRAQPDDCTAPRIDICQWTCEDGDSVNQGNGLRGIAADTAIDEAMKGQP